MFDVHTLQEEMNAALVQQRLIAMLSSLFGALALVLACVGLYGLLTFTVVQRKSELGLRMALGAQRGAVAWMVTRDALWLIGIGIAIGVPAALAGARFTASQVSGLLFGVEATDPTTIAAPCCSWRPLQLSLHIFRLGVRRESIRCRCSEPNDGQGALPSGRTMPPKNIDFRMAAWSRVPYGR